MRAPFDSARYGAMPARGVDWRLSAGPLSQGRDERTLAAWMYPSHEKAPHPRTTSHKPYLDWLWRRMH